MLVRLWDRVVDTCQLLIYFAGIVRLFQTEKVVTDRHFNEVNTIIYQKSLGLKESQLFFFFEDYLKCSFFVLLDPLYLFAPTPFTPYPLSFKLNNMISDM